MDHSYPPLVDRGARFEVEDESDDELHDAPRVGVNPHFGPPRVPLTAYRILNMTVIISFGTAKAVLTAQGQSATPTTLDWLLGVVFAVILYYVGLWEPVRPRVLPWFFHKDYGQPVFYFCGRFLGSCCMIIIRGFFLPIALFALTFIPLWFIFSPTAKGPSTILVLVRTFGFLASCVVPNLICAVFYRATPIGLLASLIKRYMPLPIQLRAAKIPRKPTKIQKYFPSNVCTSGSTLATVADLVAAVGVVGAATVTLHVLFLRFESFGSMESIGAASLMMVAVMRDEDYVEDYIYSWAVFPALAFHSCYLLITGRS